MRVIGHEMNNSLAPIKSIAGSLETLIRRDPPPADWRDDARSGLNIIATRAESLSRFMQAYARLARLPPPQKETVDLGELVRRVASLETRIPVRVGAGPESSVRGGRRADWSNCSSTFCTTRRKLRSRPAATVTIGWRELAECVEVFVRDTGPGIMNPTNLFVPFFTTKPGGSGIGLALSRQIAEAHGGSLTLANRRTDRVAKRSCGCRVRAERNQRHARARGTLR